MSRFESISLSAEGLHVNPQTLTLTAIVGRLRHVKLDERHLVFAAIDEATMQQQDRDATHAVTIDVFETEARIHDYHGTDLDAFLNPLTLATDYDNPAIIAYDKRGLQPDGYSHTLWAPRPGYNFSGLLKAVVVFK